MDSTQSLFVPDNTLAGWPGVGAYLYNPGTGTTTLASGYPYTGAAYAFYEVSVVPARGSWWLPTSLLATMPDAWSLDRYGGFEGLEVTGTAIWTLQDTQPIVRPAALYWWIPSSALQAAPNTPGRSAGLVTGKAPTIAPVGPPAEPSVVVEKTATGMKMTLQPENAVATVQGNIIVVSFP